MDLTPVNANIIKDECFNLAKSGATIIFSVRTAHGGGTQIIYWHVA